MGDNVKKKNKFMCLYTKQINAKVAIKPIRCLKIVRREGNEYFPLFYRNETIYHLGATINEDSFKEVSECGEVYYGFHTYTIGNGNVKELYFHHFKYNKVGDLVVLECEIPVGAFYYYGISNCLHPFTEREVMTETGYVSSEIRIIRELSELEIVSLNSLEVVEFAEFDF